MPTTNMSSEDLTVIHYTSNHLDHVNPRFAQAVRDQVVKAAGDYPILTVSQEPLAFGRNILASDESMGHLRCVGRSHLNIYRAILIGAMNCDTEFVGLTEDDIFYSEDQFTVHRPPPGKFAFNMNRWGINSWMRPAVFGYRARVVVNQLVSPRQLLIDALSERFEKFRGVPDSEVPISRWGDPGRLERGLGVTVREYETFATPTPSIVFSHTEAFGFANLGTKKSVGKARRDYLFPWGHASDMLRLWTDGYTEGGSIPLLAQ